MHSLIILENLNKLENLVNFISLLEMGFFEEKSEIKSVKLSVDKLFLKLVYDIDSNLKSSGNFAGSNLNISDFKTSEIIKITSDIFSEKKIKGFEQFVLDLKESELFLQSYESVASNGFFIDGTEEEIMDLKEKLLLIFAERFG